MDTCFLICLDSSQQSRFQGQKTYLEPLNGVHLGNLVLVSDLRTLRLPLRYAVSWAIKHHKKVHPVDTYTKVTRKVSLVVLIAVVFFPVPNLHVILKKIKFSPLKYRVFDTYLVLSSAEMKSENMSRPDRWALEFYPTKLVLNNVQVAFGTYVSD